MKALFILGTPILLLGFAGCATISQDQRKLDGELRDRQAPEFELTALDGQKVKLSDYRGKPVVLAFWGFG